MSEQHEIAPQVGTLSADSVSSGDLIELIPLKQATIGGAGIQGEGLMAMFIVWGVVGLPGKVCEIAMVLLLLLTVMTPVVGEEKAFSDLGTSRLELENYKLAEDFKSAAEVAERIAERAEQDGHRLQDLGSLYVELGQYKKAEAVIERAIDIFEKQWGRDSPSISDKLYHLGSLYDTQGHYAKAELIYQRALAIQETARGPNHTQVALSLAVLARNCGYQGKAAEAESLYRRAIAIYDESLPPDTPRLRSFYIVLSLAEQYLISDRLEDAESLYRGVIAMTEEVLDRRDFDQVPFGIRYLEMLAVVCRATDREAEAQALEKDVESCRKKELTSIEKRYREGGQEKGPAEVKMLAEAYMKMGAFYHGTERYAEAERLYKRGLSILGGAFAADSLVVARCEDDLGLLYFDQGRYAEAESLYKKVSNITEKALGIEHPKTAIKLENMAALYRAIGREDDVKALEKRATWIWSRPGNDRAAYLRTLAPRPGREMNGLRESTP